MVQIEETKFNTLLKLFFSEFFCDYLEEAIDNEDKSIVTLFRGMEFFFDLLKEYKIVFPYTTVKEYIVNTYSNGEEIYHKFSKRYDEELKIYISSEKSFEEMFGDTNFI